MQERIFFPPLPNKLKRVIRGDGPLPTRRPPHPHSPHPPHHHRPQVYTHKKAKAIEFMVVDALVAADPALRITHRIRDPADFQLLDDGLVDVSTRLFARGSLHVAGLHVLCCGVPAAGWRHHGHGPCSHAYPGRGRAKTQLNPMQNTKLFMHRKVPCQLASPWGGPLLTSALPPPTAVLVPRLPADDREL